MTRAAARGDSRAFCDAWLPLVSRTFGLAIRALPRPLRSAVGVAYLLCRVADTLEDDPELRPPHVGLLLGRFASCLDADGGWRPRLAAFRESLPEAWRSADAPERWLAAHPEPLFEELVRLPAPARHAIAACVRGMCADMARHSARRGPDGWLRLEATADLIQYCDCVAGRVGLMLCDLFALHEPAIGEAGLRRLRARASAFGRGLQLINVARDVAADWQRRTVFVPREMALARGLTGGCFPDPGAPAANAAVLLELLALAQHELLEAQQYVLDLPRAAFRVRLFCSWPLLLALETLEVLACRPRAAFHSGRPPKLSRGRVRTIAASGFVACVSNTLLAGLFDLHNRRAARLLGRAPSPAALPTGWAAGRQAV